MENVSYGYKGRSKALQNLSLIVPKGFVIALVGLSGCGKSTTASLLMRFCDASAGHIYMEGKRLPQHETGRTAKTYCNGSPTGKPVFRNHPGESAPC